MKKVIFSLLIAGLLSQGGSLSGAERQPQRIGSSGTKACSTPTSNSKKRKRAENGVSNPSFFVRTWRRLFGSSDEVKKPESDSKRIKTEEQEKKKVKSLASQEMNCGLANVSDSKNTNIDGDSSSLNSIIQCFAHSSYILNELSDADTEQICNTNPGSRSLQENLAVLIDEMKRHSGTQNNLYPREIVQVLHSSKIAWQQNAKSCLDFIIGKMKLDMQVIPLAVREDIKQEICIKNYCNVPKGISSRTNNNTRMLVLSLDRFKRDKTGALTKRIDAPICLDDKITIKKTDYQLKGIVLYTSKSGHYVALTKEVFTNPLDSNQWISGDQWIGYTDQKINRNLGELYKELCSSGKSKGLIPYLLFYEKIDGQSDLGEVEEMDIEPKPEWPKENVCGLANLGNTCYINSVVQCLSHCPNFLNVLLASPNGNNLEVKLTNLINDMSCYDTLYGPGRGQQPTTLSRFVNGVRDTFFEGNNGQQCAGECFHLITDSLISEDLKNTFQYGLESRTTCGVCNGVSETSELGFYISCSIPLRKKKNNVCIQDCLDRFFDNEILQLPNAYACGQCEGLVPQATKQLRLSANPEILVLHLKRFKTHEKREGTFSKICDPVCVEETIRVPVNGVEGGVEYRLKGAVLHSGTLNGGHYVAFVREVSRVSADVPWMSGWLSEQKVLQEDCWLLCDDGRAVLDEDDAMYNKIVNNGSVEKFVPYLLFYEKEN